MQTNSIVRYETPNLVLRQCAKCDQVAFILAVENTQAGEVKTPLGGRHYRTLNPARSSASPSLAL